VTECNVDAAKDLEVKRHLLYTERKLIKANASIIHELLWQSVICVWTKAAF
jgi:hypothetical protein